ncbi:hypothetical protein CO134_03710 [Candidatus Kuenenbacteria bacterium CG_4_9_14_3_um_filter_39_14]|uniref:Methyltransferase type 11 domain-containing protein n=2 Tax=Candidatus Kueneniibacteriota TaxID=1752740 RepID=A0A2M7MGH6_9BACT|nr:MAG: hypothetical protein COZ26_03240 [Candidatus Kuenenbacteria bacterium CG_4_10_14_3_um_filter_39_14]PJA91754.1 MAG: hypothetical protein CO134_03710 [Candidatus Kuenenbacteria bacterium CG_4_9_14_3_um_filter_39_14]
MIFTRYKNKFIFKNLGNVKDKDILELGCGQGDLSYELVKKGARVDAIDIRKNIKKEYLISSNLKFIQQDATCINYENLFDAVISFDVIEHIKNDKILIEKSFKALKPGGILIFGTPHKWRTYNLLKFLIGSRPSYPLVPRGGEDGNYNEVVHLREYTFKTYQELFGEINTKIFGYWIGFGVRFGLPILSSFPFLPYHDLFVIHKK